MLCKCEFSCGGTKLKIWFFGKIMALKIEAELSNINSDINTSIDEQDRKIKIERLIVKSKVAFTG